MLALQSEPPEPPVSPVHLPVMVDEVLAGLDIDRSGTYVDATFGGGGHSCALLQRLGSSGRVIALDADASVANYAQAIGDTRLSFHHANFRELDSIVPAAQHGQVAGVLFDLGLSSVQLGCAQRGFSFATLGELDMRMDTSCGHSLRDKLRRVSEIELGQVLRDYGQERRWKKLARLIVRRARANELRNTTDLAAACASGPGWQRIHPATRVFQALRIWVNDELSSLTEGLGKAAKLLRQGGRVVAISFHSLEDRIVKHFMRAAADGTQLVAQLGKLQRPGVQEQQDNRRSRSARLRVGVRL